jgi:hypothetical protein
MRCRFIVSLRFQKDFADTIKRQNVMSGKRRMVRSVD